MITLPIKISNKEVIIMCRFRKSFITKEGYNQVYAPNSPSARKNGYAPKHRVQAEKLCGGKIPAGMVVHHKNGDKLDNRKCNLEILTKSEHYDKHHKD